MIPYNFSAPLCVQEILYTLPFVNFAVLEDDGDALLTELAAVTES